MTSIVGIDTDVNGAICFVDYELAIFEFHNVPNMFEGPKNKRIVDPVETYEILARLDKKYRPDMYAIEQQNSRPGQSSVATFSFGRTYGTFFSLCSIVGGADKLYPVRPSAWKQAFRLNSIKQNAVQLAAQELERQGYKGKTPKISACEAFLITRYALAKKYTKEIK